VKLGKFANNETQVQLQDPVRGQDVFIIQTGAVRSNDCIVELLLLINSCKLASAESITVVTPYFPYSKGDQKSSLRSPITGKLLANMLSRAGATHLMMLDAHSPQMVGFFDHPVDCLKVEPLFCAWIKQNVPRWNKCIVVSPDEGGAKRSVMIANALGLDFAMIHNRHKKSLQLDHSSPTPPSLSRANSVVREPNLEDEEVPEELRLTPQMVDQYLKISGEVAGLDCILVDDMIDTGSTIRLALEVLRQHNSGKVYVVATHGIFSGPCDTILQEATNLEKLVVTNSLPQDKNRVLFGDKLEVLDVSGIVSEFIRRSHYNESLGVLSQYYYSQPTEHRGQEARQGVSEQDLALEDDMQVVDSQANPTQRLRKGYRLESVCWD